MTCTECVEYGSALLDASLDPATTREVLDHLDECDGCTGYLAQIRHTVELLADLGAGGMPG